MKGLRLAGQVGRGGFALDVGLEVPAGAVLAVLGPNGAGKTTLLRSIAGLEPLDAGEVRVDDVAWQDGSACLPPERRAVGMVFQEHRLFPHLDVRDNVAFGLGGPRRLARRRALQWLDDLGLGQLSARRPHQLSGGQAQRVALARALARAPQVLLLDEPMAALDAGARVEVRAFLRQHLGAFPGATVMVTHDPLEAMVLADRLLVLEEGRAVQQGAPQEVARRPASAYVARLMGLNLWAGRTIDGQVHLDGGGRFTVSAAAPSGTRPERVLVALAPTAVTVHTEPPAHSSTRNVWPGTVTAVEALTDRVRLEVAGPPTALVDVTHAAVAELALDAGRRVWLSAKATEAEVYADQAGRWADNMSGPVAGSA